MNSHFIQTVFSRENTVFKISSLFERESLNLTIFDSKKAWYVQVEKDKIAALAKEHKVDFDECYKNLQKYLKSNLDDVELTFSEGKFFIYLLLKNKMKIKYFTCGLNETDLQTTLYNLVDKLYNDKTQFLGELNSLQRKHGDLQKANENMENKLSEFIERKKTEEQELYNKFIAVLNEKKRHIQHLNDLLIAFRKGRPTINPPVVTKIKKNGNATKNAKSRNNNLKTVVRKSEDSNSSNSSDNYNTDNEDDNMRTTSGIGINSNNGLKRCASPLPSTSKAKLSFILEDSPSVSLSRRTKTEDNNSSLNVNLPSNHSTEKIEKQAVVEESYSMVKDEESPTVNFSTQELLDNL